MNKARRVSERASGPAGAGTEGSAAAAARSPSRLIRGWALEESGETMLSLLRMISRVVRFMQGGEPALDTELARFIMCKQKKQK